jgi:hypothetical protein
MPENIFRGIKNISEEMDIMKKLLCIILVIMMCSLNIAFASDYAYIDSYKTDVLAIAQLVL